MDQQKKNKDFLQGFPIIEVLLEDLEVPVLLFLLYRDRLHLPYIYKKKSEIIIQSLQELFSRIVLVRSRKLRYLVEIDVTIF